jgi:hypothetical protein
MELVFNVQLNVCEQIIRVDRESSTSWFLTSQLAASQEPSVYRDLHFVIITWKGKFPFFSFYFFLDLIIIHWNQNETIENWNLVWFSLCICRVVKYSLFKTELEILIGLVLTGLKVAAQSALNWLHNNLNYVYVDRYQNYL